MARSELTDLTDLEVVARAEDLFGPTSPTVPPSPARQRVQAAADTLLERIEDEIETGDAELLGDLSYALSNLHSVMEDMRHEEQGW